jgi:isopenicillin N synthase-like dioxygenase
MNDDAASLPVIDMSPLFGDDAARQQRVARGIAAACRDSGFFYVTGHGIADDTLRALAAASRRFFAQHLEAKMAIAMAKGGRA